jgi:probable rRNA maturation factor
MVIILAMPIEIVRRDAGKEFPSRKLKTIAQKILELVGQNRAELSLALVENSEIQTLNAKYRKKDYPTDVLSFPVEDPLPAKERLLGDVVISVQKAKEQAKQGRRSLDEEMMTLLIHGVLHLLGYDHERSAQEARIMTRLEKRIYRVLCDQGILEYNKNCAQRSLRRLTPGTR